MQVPIREGVIIKMPQALDPTAYIHEGVWIDWTKGRVQGLTLTLAPTGANILIAMLALFVTMSGGQLWTILRYTLHQIRASDKSRTLSMLHNQEQVVLRNATSDIAAARLLLELAWSSRKNAVKSYHASTGIMVLAVIHFVFFLVAGTFSASLANAGQAVLSRSPHCGSFNQTYLAMAGDGIDAATNETFTLSVEFIAKKEQDIQLSLEYARECYMSQDSNMSSSNCGTFQRPLLYWTTIQNGSCPFGSKTCLDSLDTMVIDTGLINSHNNLGINADYNDRLSYRRVTNCTILNDTAFMTGSINQTVTGWINQTDGTGTQPSLKVTYANYGRSLSDLTDWTYAYSNFADFYTNFSGQTTTPYQVFPAIAYGNSSDPSKSTFVPIHELKQSQADLTLLFLSFTGRYVAPIDDPWFSAHQLRVVNSRAALARSAYTRDRPVSTLGCTEQHQICTNDGICTPLLGFDQVQNFVDSNFNLRPHQNVTLDRIMRVVADSVISQIVQGLAVSSTPMLAMNSRATAITTLSLPLPSNQWQLEVEYWHSVAMAQLQRKFVQYGTGQFAVRTAYILPPATESERWICENLMIRGTVFQSFSVLALALIVVFGSLIVLVSLYVENLGTYVQKQLRKGCTGREIWDDHDMLGPQIWRKRFDEQSPSRNDSFETTQDEKDVQKDSKGIATMSVVGADEGHCVQGGPLESYRVGDMPRHQESWI